MAYPDKNHGIYGGQTRPQLYQKMTDFIFGEPLISLNDGSKKITQNFE